MTKGTHSQTILASNEDARSLELEVRLHFFVIGPDGNITRLFGAQPYEVFVETFEIELEKIKISDQLSKIVQKS